MSDDVWVVVKMSRDRAERAVKFTMKYGTSLMPAYIVDEYDTAIHAALARKAGSVRIGQACGWETDSWLVHEDSDDGRGDFCLGAYRNTSHVRVLVVPLGEEEK